MFEVICYRAEFELFSKVSSHWIRGCRLIAMMTLL